MPKDPGFKRLVRERMTKTGESYTAARLQLLRQRGLTTDSDPATATTPMFARPWARTISLAQDWARLLESELLEPEHVLLGLLDAGGPPVALLLDMRVSTPALRHAVEQLLRGSPGRLQAPVRPRLSDRLQELLLRIVDEEESADDHHRPYVVLLALAGEGGPAASALAEYGASELRLRAALDQADRPPPEVLAAITSATEAIVGAHAFEHIELVRDERGLRVEIVTATPGHVVGRAGAVADRLRAEVERICGEPCRINVVQTKA